MKYKKISIIKLLIIMTLLLVSMVGCGKNTARTIKVEELEGTADVTNGEGTSNAYEGQNLQSGDEVGVMDESSLLLLLDTDKHVFATEGADFVIVADGVNKQTKTIIEQSSGTMIFGIDNKLGSEETFHVKTPNATMAVRGTVFTVEVSGGATPVTELSVKEGCIEVSTVENGETVTKDVNAGEVVTFTGNNPEFSGELQTDDSESDTVIAENISAGSDGGSGESLIEIKEGHDVNEEEFKNRVATYDEVDGTFIKGHYERFEEHFKEQFEERERQRLSTYYVDYIFVPDEAVACDGASVGMLVAEINFRHFPDMTAEDVMAPIFGQEVEIYATVEPTTKPDDPDDIWVVDDWIGEPLYTVVMYDYRTIN